MAGKKEYLAGKLLAAAVSSAWMFGTTDTGGLMVRALVLCCLFVLQRLFEVSRIDGKVKKCGVRICQAAALGAVFWFGGDRYFPVAVAAVAELLDDLVSGMLFYEMGAVCFLLLWFLCSPDQAATLFGIVFAGCLLMLRDVEERRASLWRANLEQKEKLAGMQNRLNDMQIYTRTLRETAASEERSRFAARIHDRLGHSISGSIILLEAASMTLEKDPESARRSLDLAAENLRMGVDDIRAALRQERPGIDRLGTHALQRILQEFQVTYGRRTHLETEGDMERIPAAVWVCMQENLKEALTNMLKHSSGGAFTLCIQALEQAVRVEYRDDGVCGEEFEKGMGLCAIEERTAGAGGKCMITGGRKGFRILLVFPIPDGGDRER